jgi:hypothetical protein
MELSPGTTLQLAPNCFCTKALSMAEGGACANENVAQASNAKVKMLRRMFIGDRMI